MIKIIATKQIREILRTQWPGLQHIWIFDKRLILLPLNQIKTILDSIYKKHRYQFQDETFDCDDFALVMNAYMKIEIASMNLSHNGAFGEASMIHSTMGIHNQNIFITDDLKVKLYEPQSDRTIEPGQGETIFYVRM